MKRSKSGVSLIVLVITIIVMIILASAIIISLSSTNIINKAGEAVDANNLQEVQQLAALAWSEAYIDTMEEELTEEEKLAKLDTAVKKALEDNNVKHDLYNITVTISGVYVEKKPSTTLGSLITSAEMYGTKVNYEANGVTDWKVFYKQTVGTEEYVYLIASEELAYDKVPTILSTTYGATIASATVTLSDTESRTVGNISWSSIPAGMAVVSTAKDKWLAEWSNYASGTNAKAVSYLLDENIWSLFSNTTKYVDANGVSYVKGAIGTPTAEMFVASWNEKREIAVSRGDTTTYNKKLDLVENGTTGYYVNDITNGEATSNTTYQYITTIDPLYIWSTKEYSSVWLASPSGSHPSYLQFVRYIGIVSNTGYGTETLGVRPVVCLNSKIPASVDANGNFVI